MFYIMYEGDVNIDKDGEVVPGTPNGRDGRFTVHGVRVAPGQGRGLAGLPDSDRAPSRGTCDLLKNRKFEDEATCCRQTGLVEPME